MISLHTISHKFSLRKNGPISKYVRTVFDLHSCLCEICYFNFILRHSELKMTLICKMLVLRMYCFGYNNFDCHHCVTFTSRPVRKFTSIVSDVTC